MTENTPAGGPMSGTVNDYGAQPSNFEGKGVPADLGQDNPLAQEAGEAPRLEDASITAGEEVRQDEEGVS